MVLHEILTTEKVPFTYRVAGLGARYLALLVDLALLVLLLFAGRMATVVMDIGRMGLGLAVFFLWSFVLFWGYFLLFEWLWDGQTPGKRLLGIRVIRRNGTSLGFVGSALRNIVRVIDLLPGFYGVGFLVAACNRENCRLGDLAGDTLVVHVALRGGPIQALLDAGADEARTLLLRQRLTLLDREQRQTLLDLCLRRDQLRVAERAQLFSDASRYVQERLDLDPDEYESDEKFVLKLGAVLGERS